MGVRVEGSSPRLGLGLVLRHAELVSVPFRVVCCPLTPVCREGSTELAIKKNYPCKDVKTAVGLFAVFMLAC